MRILASSSFPAKNPFESGGRSYGTAVSAETMASSPAFSPRSASSLAAYPATIPPPRITYFQWFMHSPPQRECQGWIVTLAPRLQLCSRGNKMLYYALVFFVLAILAAVLGFAGIAVAFAGIAKILFVLFLVLFLVSLLMHLGRRV